MRLPAKLAAWLRRGLAGVLLLAVAAIAGVLLLVAAGLPDWDSGEQRMAGLQAAVAVEFDDRGIPRIQAQNRSDAYRALGFVTAQDRLFQMDMLRRRSAGRLAEILGEPLLASDRWHRTMGFQPVADAIWARLPPEQKAVLEAYADGVNQALDGLRVLPFECLLLRYRPEPWRPQDSLLAVLGIFEILTWKTGEQELRASVMEAALGKEAVDFLLPETDRFTDGITAAKPWRPLTALPRRALAALLAGQQRQIGLEQVGLVQAAPLPVGSNGWLVAPGKSRSGQAMLANDMHLALRVPNIWYRAELRLPGRLLAGFTLPGLPLFISASNGQVAWGFTSVGGDFLDFVRLEPAQDAPGSYRTPWGRAVFGQRREIIRVKGRANEILDVRTSLWGPVLPEPLLGQPVAVHWSALDPEATDLGLLALEEAQDVAQALPVLQASGGPPLNGLLADSHGNIAWSYAGKIPHRYNLDGLFSRSWADGMRGWYGYVAAGDKPSIVNPPAGFLANANQRMVGREYPHVIGQDFDSGYRAARISERLAQMQGVAEADLLQLQLDSRAEFYRYYQQLALALLDSGAARLPADLQALREDVQSWDGRAEPDSRGLAVLVEFRGLLAEAVLSPYLARCRALDPAFQYTWRNLDAPLQQLLDAKAQELLPQPERYADWNALLLEQLQTAAQRVLSRCGADSLAAVRWGCVNRAQIEHPFSAASPWLGALLDMPGAALSGCPQCVRLASGKGGASERLVVAPGSEQDGLLQMPGGQSGNPLSAFYRDQQQDWLAGNAVPLLAGETRRRLLLQPAAR